MFTEGVTDGQGGCRQQAGLDSSQQAVWHIHTSAAHMQLHDVAPCNLLKMHTQRATLPMASSTGVGRLLLCGEGALMRQSMSRDTLDPGAATAGSRGGIGPT